MKTILKNISAIAVVFVAIGLSSCSKDNAVDPVYPEQPLPPTIENPITVVPDPFE